jgi:hypothetical protein
MNRTPLAPVFLVAAALLGGCAGEGSGQTMNHPFRKKSAAVAPADPGKANYFEMKKDGRTYVFSRMESMNGFREGKAPAKTSTQAFDGKTVVFENRGFTDYNRLVAEYKKAHNIQ